MTTMPTEPAFHMGERAFDERNYRDAVEHFTDVLDKEPGNRLTREYLARALYHRARLGRAIEQCEALLAAGPTDEYARLLLIRSLERRGEHDRAAGLRRHLTAHTGDERHLASHTALGWPTHEWAGCPVMGHPAPINMIITGYIGAMTTELPLANQSGGCGCGHAHEAEVPTLEARQIPHAVRHGAIIGALGQLPSGGRMDLIAPHVPTPLLDQIDQLFPGVYTHEVLDPTPEAYRIRFTKA